MAEKMIVVTERDAKILREIVAWWESKTRNSGKFRQELGIEHWTPEVYLAQTLGTSVIDYDGTGDTFPYGDCEVLTLGTGDPPSVRTVGRTIRVHNYSNQEVPAEDTFLAVRDKFGNWVAVQSDGGTVWIRGLSQGVITAGTTGIIDNLVVLSGSYTIPGSGEQSIYVPTTAYDTYDNAPTWAIRRNDGVFEMVNSECLGTV